MTSAILVQRSNQLSYQANWEPRVYNELTIDQLPGWLDSSVGKSAALVSQRSWVRFPFKPEFFSGLLFPQLLKLSTYCDDLHLLKMYFPQYKYMSFVDSNIVDPDDHNDIFRLCIGKV